MKQELPDMKAQEDKYIFSDETDYSIESKASVWGTEEQLTIDCIEKANISGVWLNLCAGDGRFNKLLLEKADKVIAADIDINPLNKLKRNTPNNLQNKLEILTMNVVDEFPLPNNELDGIFCTGTLHLFPEDILCKIATQIERVLKTNGVLIIDFATDINRVKPDGTNWVLKNEPSYSLSEAEKLLKDIFSNYKNEMEFGISEPEQVDLGDKKYMFSANYILLKATKIN